MNGHAYVSPFKYVASKHVSYHCVQKLTSSIKENPRLRAAAEELRKQGVKVGDAVSEALKSMEESDLMRAVRHPVFCSLAPVLTEMMLVFRMF